MDHIQMEFNFGDGVATSDALASVASNVVVLSRYASARQVVLLEQARSRLVDSIVDSVDDLWDDLEAM